MQVKPPVADRGSQSFMRSMASHSPMQDALLLTTSADILNGPCSDGAC